MKRLFSVVLSVLMLASIFSKAVCVHADYIDAKIDSALIEKLDNAESSTSLAFVMLEDVNHNEVMESFQKYYPAEYAAYVSAKQFEVGDVVEGDIAEMDDDLLQRAIEIKRELFSEAYATLNTEIVESYYDQDEIIYISNYAPVAIVETDNQSVTRLASDTAVVDVCYFSNDVLDAEGGYSILYDTFIDGLDFANEITNVSYTRDNNQLKGEGVVVGIIEANGVPDITNPYLQNADITIRPGDEGYTSNHATAVACIIVAEDQQGRQHGVAPDAELFCASCTTVNEFYVAVEWLINSGVNVINASLGFNYYPGIYDSISAWVDHIAVLHDVHFVKSAGNYDYYNQGYVTSPGMAYNAITVGAFNPNRTNEPYWFTMYDSSNYIEYGENRAEKPNIVAPVCFYDAMLYEGEISDLTGTSFAAPQVTGVIAQMCSNNSVLKVKQSAVGAILMASALRKVDARTTGELGDEFDITVYIENNNQVSNTSGAGILDSRSANMIIVQGNFASPIVYASNFPHTRTISINASQGTITRVVIFWLKKNGITNHLGSALDSSTPLANLSLKVYRPDGSLAGQSNLTYANFEIVQIYTPVSGQYTVVIDGESVDKEYIGFAIWN